MKERTEPCRQCGLFDFYYRGDFSYCRPCKNETDKRLKMFAKESKPIPVRDLEFLLSPKGRRSSHERAKVSCPRGHPYSGDNLILTTQKNGKSPNRKCKTCERNRLRRLYGIATEPDPTKLSDLLDNE